MAKRSKATKALEGVIGIQEHHGYSASEEGALSGHSAFEHPDWTFRVDFARSPAWVDSHSPRLGRSISQGTMPILEMTCAYQGGVHELAGLERMWAEQGPWDLAHRSEDLQPRHVAIGAQLREVMNELKQFADREQKHDQQLQQLRREMAELRAIIGLDDGRAPYADPAAQYVEDHPEEVLRFAGQHVAIHAERGIVAHGPSFDDVYREATRQGVADEVTFDVIVAP